MICPECLSGEEMKKQSYCYVISQGLHHQESYVLCVCRTKKIAVEKCRKDGYSYYRKEYLWDNGEYYREVKREIFYTWTTK